jgi:hypothetical protein
MFVSLSLDQMLKTVPSTQANSAFDTPFLYLLPARMEDGLLQSRRDLGNDIPCRSSTHFLIEEMFGSD